ncbi:response regulator [Fulvivirga lutea]|uniref:Response regulator transcription factor n=1 Tax=Fulvivirga lutea TaxID=2810512 RepID=A0A975A0R7_9BACT|nr:response regulator transcription factor [Fulvivirga lutea]QSE97091.1 response regulator transcription factor [Fulvivirga lutea]
MNKYRILLVDDHQILLEGTKNLINQSELFLVADTSNSAEKARELLLANDYDILVTDYQMQGMDGSQLIQIAKSVLPELKIIVLSMHDDSHIVKDLLKKGVDGYVLKSDTHDSILNALDKVTSGKRFLSDEIAELLIQNIDEEVNSALTPREEEIVRLIVKEYSTKQIAEILFISERTVETHRKNILKKTGCSNLVALIKYAYQHHLA